MVSGVDKSTGEPLVVVSEFVVKNEASMTPVPEELAAPGIYPTTLVDVIVGAPTVVLQVAARSMASVAVVSMVQAELVCMGASPGVRVAPVPSKMQFAI